MSKQTYPIRGETIKKARARQVMTQTVLSERTGLSSQHISMLETHGVSRVHASTAHKLAAALGLELSDLIEDLADTVEEVVPVGGRLR